MQSPAGVDHPQQQLQAAAPPPPQWVPMQYPMVMVPAHQNYLHRFNPYPMAGNGLAAPVKGTEENTSIWVGDLQYWMDESYLHSCFGRTGEVISIKVIRNKQTGHSEGYGFVEFNSRAAAEMVLQNFNATPMPASDQHFRLNWATFSMGDRRTEAESDHSIFVGDLASDVTDAILQETFSSKYPSVKEAKVVMDINTGRSKGYGFVRFGVDNERSRAISEMNGAYCSSRPMRIGAATPRKFSGSQQASSTSQSDGDMVNTTIFVGGLDPSTSDEFLKQTFSQYGEIVSVKIPVGKGCGFVQFANRNHAEEALQKLNGTVIGKQTVRLSWGRNWAHRQHRADHHANYWNGAYYGGQFYDGYGYGIPHRNMGMYAPAAYGTYPVYGQQQVS